MSPSSLRYLLVLVMTVFIVTIDAAGMTASISFPPPKQSAAGLMDMPSDQSNGWNRDPGFQGASMGPVRVIVRLRKTLPESSSTRPAAGKLKKEFTTKHLKDLTQKRIDKLVRKLNRRRSEGKHLGRWKKQHPKPPRSLWLANAVAMTVDSDDIEELLQDPDVVDVVPNATLSIPPVSYVPASANGSDGSPTMWNHEQIGLDYLQQQGLDGTGIRIGILDTGVEVDHPELQGKITAWQEFDALGNTVPSEPHETHYVAHGTHVASILVGEQTGIAPRAELLCALVLPDGYGTTEQVVSGMQWVLDPDGDSDTDDGAQIVNMSWGMAGTSTVLQAAIESMVAAGVLPVAAIGNNGRDSTFSPANAPGAIGVGAMNEYDNIAVFSGGGEVCWDGLCINKPDVAAPGVNIYGAAAEGGYQYLSGTSVAAPHVAGSAALLWQYDAALKLPQLTRFLTHSSVDLGFYGLDPRFGWGGLNIQSAVEFTDLYANRIGCADLVIEKPRSRNGKNFYLYFTFFSDGEAEFLPNISDFLKLAPLSNPSSIEAVGVGDVDGDGYADLVIRHTTPLENGTYTINWEVYPSMGAHGFSAIGTTWYTIESADPEAYRLIGIVDADGDQRSDLVLSRVESLKRKEVHHIFALLSTGTRFALPTENDWASITTSSYYRYHFGTGDVNGDGRSDLIMTETFNNPYTLEPTRCYVGLSQADGFGPLRVWRTLDTGYPNQPIDQFFFQDVNGDGYDDLVFLQEGDYGSGIDIYASVCLSYGGNQFLQPKKWAEIGTEHSPIVETLADVNGDKAHDLVVRYYNQEMDTNTIHVWLADRQNQEFVPSETAWFEDPDGIIFSDNAKVVGVANVGLGTW